MASNGAVRSPEQTVSASSSERSDELERKRARDRKSQQAMRDRTKWQLQNLTEQVTYLSRLVEEKNEHNARMQVQVQSLQSELEQLKDENGALRLRLIGQPIDSLESRSDTLPLWQIPTANTTPTCMSDQIIQSFVASSRAGEEIAPSTPGLHTAVATYADRPNLCFLLDRNHRPADALSNMVGDIVLSYKEIETLPKQASVFYIIATLLKWQLLLDEPSWKQVPTFLRPTQQQLTVPHAAWIDRIPWPRVRKYLIEHPAITLDDFAVVYSTNFDISWPYDPQHVVLQAGSSEYDSNLVVINPVFQEHIQEIRTWVVTEAFRVRFPEMAELIDEDTRPA
jgi:hypothetical protein